MVLLYGSVGHRGHNTDATLYFPAEQRTRDRSPTAGGPGRLAQKNRLYASKLLFRS